MTQVSPGQRPIVQQPQSDIYTALLAIATVFVAAATVFVIVRAVQIFGSIVPP